MNAQMTRVVVSLACAVWIGLVSSSWAAEPEKPAAKPRITLPKTGQIRFEKHLLIKNKNEAIAVADVNQDGKLDLTAGPYWFEGPDWKQHPLRDVSEPNKEFMGNNGEYLYDLNGDGYPDLISGSWFNDKVWRYENPGKEGLAAGRKWKEGVVTTGQTANEAMLFEDLDGDGIPELIPDRWEANHPVLVVRITPGKDGAPPRFTDFFLNKKGPNGHGMGIGDLNGDGRKDVVLSDGWYEGPAQDPWSKEWTFHKFEKSLGGHESVPMLVLDVNGDGLTDVIHGRAHDYGLLWQEQVKSEDGVIRFKQHLIDDVFSQVHYLAWADLDGDGNMEIITGKRYRAHGDGDPGAHDPVCLMRYEWDPKAKKFERDVISWDDGVSSGMQILIVDLNGDNRLDIAVAGKTGTYVLINKG